MQTVNNDNFGPLIAYLVPGATTLIGINSIKLPVADMLVIDQLMTPTIGGFLLISIVAIALGMAISAVRWLLIDTALRYFGVRPLKMNFALLADRVEAYTVLNEIHYRHYLYYSNMLVAFGICYVFLWWNFPSRDLGWIDTTWLVIELIFFAAARDTLSKYYRRLAQLMRPVDAAA